MLESPGGGERLKRLPASERAYGIIRNAILEGEYRPGARLVEDTLASLAGVSRTPVRTALQRLVQEGFVVWHPNAGAVVRGWTAAEAAETYEVRAALESLAAGRAARRASAADVRELAQLCERMEAVPCDRDNGGQLAKLNRSFHLKVLELSGNRRLALTAVTLMDLGALIRAGREISYEDWQHGLRQHRDLVAAIAAGESSWATAAMHAHILAAGTLMQMKSDADV